ncbi:MAG: bifunctional demethylmenaquinone methyltransferase/2-methoxy-6-polyprenyl-1,4-benzoquinol methylase UbiE [Phycisphaerae bacterium]|jgi:demethylmenaquinone methyltransferase / 2-methoxy-6-polyprenyl-1,4-benzoquinol methylase|nr:bifunctional demethylmenaquinone methyltransferase/2-methoxy-6-polyprenyl-1,4-benzoquinol methylase UbiE [Phycisphaerae bacterium]
MSPPEEVTQEKPAWSDSELTQNPHDAQDKAKKVEDMFTSIAHRYDLNNRLHSMWRDQTWRKRAVKLAQVTNRDDVVDVACGTGDLSMAFYKSGVRSVLGIDFTQAMLDFAMAKATKEQMDITYRFGDAMDLNLPEKCADVVSIAFGIRNVQKPDLAFREFFRILRPGGRLIVLEFSNPKNCIVSFINSVYTKHIMPVTATLISRDQSGAYKYLPKSVETFAEPAVLAKEIEEAGFSAIEQHAQTFGVCTITKAVKI